MSVLSYGWIYGYDMPVCLFIGVSRYICTNLFIQGSRKPTNWISRQTHTFVVFPKPPHRALTYTQKKP